MIIMLYNYDEEVMKKKTKKNLRKVAVWSLLILMTVGLLTGVISMILS